VETNLSSIKQPAREHLYSLTFSPTAEQYVIPGNIIYRQRGTLWFPGDNCAMGRDHTIYATQPGYVKYYRDPVTHPKRQFIGVVFERSQTLPQPPHAVRRRRLGMLAYRMKGAEEVGDALSHLDEQGPGNAAESVAQGDLVTGQHTGIPPAQPSTIREAPREERGKRVTTTTVREKGVRKSALTLRPGYQYRQANWEIGRAAERKAERSGRTVRPVRRKDWMRGRRAMKFEALAKVKAARSRNASKGKGKAKK